MNVSQTLNGLVVGMLVVCSSAWAAPMTGGNGPGGFEAADGASTLRLWLDAGKGVYTDDGFGGVGPLATPGQDVRQWQDLSGYGSDANQTTGANQPSFQTGVQNGRPGIRFNGTTDTMATTTPNNTNITVLVSYANRSGTNGSFYGTPGPNDPLQRNTSLWADSSSGSMSLSQSLNSNNLLTTRFQFAGGGSYQAYLDGAQVGTLTGNRTFNSGNFFVGARFGGGEFLNGDISEMLVFHRVLNQAERLIAENSLASKYGVNLASASRYAGANYDQDVFGVGRVSAGNEVTVAGNAGLGFEITGGALVDDDFVLAGHNSSVNSMDSEGMWSRVWYVDTNGGLDNAEITLTFDGSDAGLSLNEGQSVDLLYSALEGGPFTVLEQIGVSDGDQLSFAFAAGTLQSGFYTLSVDLSVPEPASCGLLMLGAFFVAIRRRRKRNMA